MIIRLTASCNNRCFFCMVDEEIARHAFRPFAEIAAEIDAVPPDEVIDVFGGEPTIDPVFWDVLARALRSGRQVTLATNVRLFAHRPAAERLRDLAQRRLLIRTTLMGHTAELHDALNGVASSAFHQTVRGIRNLSELGFDVQTNIVILARNVDHLLATALVAVQAGSRRLKFSGSIRTMGFLDAIADPAIVRSRLRSIVPLLLALGVSVKLEKLTPCLVPDLLAILNREMDPAPDSQSWYRKVDACSRCALLPTCAGAEAGALHRFGEGWVEPIPELSPALIDDVDASELESYQPQKGKPFVRVRFSPAPDDTLEALGHVAAFASRNPHVHLIA